MKISYTLSVILISCTQILADPPSDIRAYKVKGAHAIHLSIMHKVKKPKEHFIDVVTVLYQGIPVYEGTFNEQNFPASLEIDIPDSVALTREALEDEEMLGDSDQLGDTTEPRILAIQVRDKIKVYAHCNKRGDKTKDVIVQETP